MARDVLLSRGRPCASLDDGEASMDAAFELARALDESGGGGTVEAGEPRCERLGARPTERVWRWPWGGTSCAEKGSSELLLGLVLASAGCGGSAGAAAPSDDGDAGAGKREPRSRSCAWRYEREVRAGGDAGGSLLRLSESERPCGGPANAAWGSGGGWWCPRWRAVCARSSECAWWCEWPDELAGETGTTQAPLEGGG